jgi:peptidyl-prolyl cis-trans isomerase SurA
MFIKRVSILSLLLSATLFGEIINGIAIRVNGEAITTYDIDKAVKESKQPRANVVKLLIQNILEDGEIKKLGLEASNREVDQFIDNIVTQNRMSSREQLYAQLSNEGIDRKDFRESAKRQILRPKLYQRIASLKISTPSEDEMREHFQNNISKYQSAKEFRVTIYSSTSREELERQLMNPLRTSQFVRVENKVLDASRVAPQLSSVLQNLKEGEFSPVLPIGGGFVSFFLIDRGAINEVSFEDVRKQIENELYFQQQGKIVESHFQEIGEDAIIEYIR